MRNRRTILSTPESREWTLGGELYQDRDKNHRHKIIRGVGRGHFRPDVGEIQESFYINSLSFMSLN